VGHRLTFPIKILLLYPYFYFITIVLPSSQSFSRFFFTCCVSDPASILFHFIITSKNPVNHTACVCRFLQWRDIFFSLCLAFSFFKKTLRCWSMSFNFIFAMFTNNWARLMRHAYIFFNIFFEFLKQFGKNLINMLNQIRMLYEFLLGWLKFELLEIILHNNNVFLNKGKNRIKNYNLFILSIL